MTNLENYVMGRFDEYLKYESEIKMSSDFDQWLNGTMDVMLTWGHECMEFWNTDPEECWYWRPFDVGECKDFEDVCRATLDRMVYEDLYGAIKAKWEAIKND